MADPNALIIQTIGIIKKFQETRQQIISGHPNFDEIRDSRITTFTNCIVVLDGVYVCFLVRNFELWEDEWWIKMKDNMNGKIRIPSPKKIFIKGFDSFTITAYFSLLFNALENGFRSFYKTIFPSKEIPGFFFYVCKDILDQLITDQTILNEYHKLMKILRLVRNAETHTNGFHVDDDDEVTWNKMTIIFKKGKHINYGGRDLWTVVLSLTEGILDLLNEIVNSNEIIQGPEIVDPSYSDL